MVSENTAKHPIVRALALLLAGIVLLSALVVLPVPSRAEQAKTDDTSDLYTKKVVSVLYDNSGSMNNADNRRYYALYALEMLISLLGDQDELCITPMNENGSAVTSTAKGTWVDLSKPDRKQAMADVINKMSAAPSGGTPAGPIDLAAQQLLAADTPMQPVGPGDEEANDNTEYWLVILTDGYFERSRNEQGIYVDGPELVKDTVTKYANGYRSFRTIYLSFGDKPDENDSQYEDYLKTQDMLSELAATTPTTAYAATPVTTLSGIMQSIANQLSGRYTAKESDYTVNGNRVTVDLDNLGYAVRNISVLAQNCGATVQSATYNGATIEVSRPCVIAPTGDIVWSESNQNGLKNGFSGVLVGDPTFSGGKLELVFDKSLDADGATLAILVEPALYLTTYMEYQKDGKWYAGDAQYINSNMQPDDYIRIGYRVLEAGSDREIPFGELFGEATSKVTYAGNTYEAGQGFALVKGTNEISLAVSVMNGAYTMYATTMCVIEQNPTYYRLVAGTPTYIDGNAAKTQTVITPYVNDKAMTVEQLATYTYTVTLKTASGTELPVSHRTEGGKIVVTANVTGNPFGEYTLFCRIRSAEGISRECTAAVRYYPASISVVTEGETALSMTQFGAESNTAGYTFRLTAEGAALTFDNPLVRYALTAGGVDLTAGATVSGDLLTFVPNVQTLGSLAGKDGEHKISLRVWLDGVSELDSTAAVSLTLAPTSFVIRPIEQSKSPIDRFALSKNQTSSYFRVIRDGKSLSAEELTAAIESGALTFSAPMYEKGLLPAGQEVTVETLDGEPVVRVRTVSDQPGILSFFTAMLMSGKDQTVTALYAGAKAEDTVAIAKASFMDYFLPLSVIGAIIYTILFFALRPGCRKLQRAVLFRVTKREGAEPRVTVEYCFNDTFFKRLIPMRLIPFFGLRMAQSPVTVGGNFTFSCGRMVGGKMQMDTAANIKVFTRSQIESEAFKSLLAACQNYAKGTQHAIPHLNCKSSELVSTFHCDAFTNSEEADPDFYKSGSHLNICPEIWAQYDRSGNLRHVYVLVAQGR